MRFDEKHEPQCFKELIFADATARSICERYVKNKPYKSLLLWGEPGTAKTTTARVIMKERLAQNGYHDNFEELNGAGFKVDKMEETMINLASMLRYSAGEEILIINELDGLDRNEQAKFRAFMDKFKFISFIATTNEKPGVFGMKQLLMPALLSRFEVVELAQPKPEDCYLRAQEIFASEGHAVTEASLKVLLANFTGDIRELLPAIESALEQLNAQNTTTSVTQNSATQSHLKVVSSNSSIQK